MLEANLLALPTELRRGSTLWAMSLGYVRTCSHAHPDPPGQSAACITLGLSWGYPTHELSTFSKGIAKGILGKETTAGETGALFKL